MTSVQVECLKIFHLPTREVLSEAPAGTVCVDGLSVARHPANEQRQAPPGGLRTTATGFRNKRRAGSSAQSGQRNGAAQSTGRSR